MRRAPILAAAIVLTLGLGAAAAIFTTAQAALIDPLPYVESSPGGTPLGRVDRLYRW
jgi:hypothetical protein